MAFSYQTTGPPVNKTQKPQPVVMLTITPGPVTPAQREKWRRFWAKLVAEAKSEAKNG